MKSRKHIVPIFIPHKGCPHDCVFCNQKKISGHEEPPSEQEVIATIERHLSTNSAQEFEIAFYGGSFTGISLKEQEMYLNIADSYRKTYENLNINIRASTRPDCINNEVINLLLKYRVDLIELGVQSMNDKVLSISNRGHTSNDVYTAVSMLENAGIAVGIQTMIGLPGDCGESAVETARKVVLLKPLVVRIYPTLVIKDTALCEMYRNREYTPLTISEAVELAAVLTDIYEEADINVIRVGLQPTDNVRLAEGGSEGDVVAGPFHPAFRQLVQSERVYKRIMKALNASAESMANLCIETEEDVERKIIYVKPDKYSISDILGQRRSNVTRIREETGYTIKVLLS